MYEYKILSASVKEAEKTLNQYAKEGWRLVTTLPNIGIGVGLTGLVCTLERKVGEGLTGAENA